MQRIKNLLIATLFFGPFLTGALANENNIDRRDHDFAEDSKDEAPINSKYLRGVWLIYDCEEHYYTCVDRQSFDNCKIARNKNIKYTKAPKHPCAPFKKFETRLACLKEQYRLIQSGGNLSLCNFKP